MKNANKGFTLIELLVVIAIIGLLSTLAVVALNSARQRSRDAKRVADIRQVQTALELGFSEDSAYPYDSTVTYPVTLGDSTAATTILCSDSSGGVLFTSTSTDCTGTTFMGLVPSAPTPPSGNAYTYKTTDGSSYCIDFTLESATGQLGSGANHATPDGITSGSCP